MALYAISDLHLALGINKPMDIFGDRWNNYMDKLKKLWSETVTESDYVVIPGDISWATYLEQAEEDFRFIHSLPGIKIIAKGNHDYWWTTLSKLEGFIARHNFSSIRFMHNNSFKLDKIVLCGTRGWKCPGDEDFNAEDRKIYNRELQRLQMSLKSAQPGKDEEIVAALHYPPFNLKREPSEFVDILRAFRVKTCIYGHLHGEGFKNAVTGNICGVQFKLVSADYLNFTPLKLEEHDGC
ncbi:MAG: metallophosphoesterase [Clostridiales bacterium]|nr:metallophosphoesterase [Eubacteriales bacterium]MDH7566910.1 metallophosphoesterase [Clostridiales bacterium]